MKDINRFIKRNFNIYHIIGIVFGTTFSMIYWIKVGRFSDNFLKSSPILMTIWGILLGYITFDLVFNAKERKDKQESEK